MPNCVKLAAARRRVDTVSSCGAPTAVDHELAAGAVGTLVREKEHDEPGDLVGLFATVAVLQREPFRSWDRPAEVRQGDLRGALHGRDLVVGERDGAPEGRSNGRDRRA